MSLAFGFGLPHWLPLSGGFSPLSLFGPGIQGTWYDPSDYGSTGTGGVGTLFQDSAGTTPVTGVEQVVGLMLDKSQGLVLGPELFTGFTSTGTWTVSGTTYSISSAASQQDLRVDFVGTVGKRYVISFTASGVSGTVVTYPLNTNPPGIANGQNTFRQVSDAGFFIIRAVAGASATITNISVRELPGNHATATGAARPTLRARYNLLTYSEEFDQGVWTKNQVTAANTTATTDPLGGNTAEKLASNTAASVDHTVDQSVVINSVTTFTVYAKAAELSRIAIGRTSGPVAKVFDLVAGTAHDLGPTSWSGWTSASAGNFSITSAGNGWWRLSITASASASAGRNDIYLIDNNGNERTFATASGNGVYIWGAQLLTAADAFATGNRYQRIAAATDYDTTGFLPYLAFGGTQAMSTGSINFTATDKMTVWAGVTKLSDAAIGVFAELSANFNTNNGSFVQLPNSNGAVATNTYSSGSRGTAASSTFQFAISAATPAPATNVFTSTYNISGDLSAIRLNGAASGTDGTFDQGSGNYGNYPLYIGARNLASLFLNGRLYQLCTRGAQSTAAEISAMENYTNQRTGAY